MMSVEGIFQYIAKGDNKEKRCEAVNPEDPYFEDDEVRLSDWGPIQISGIFVWQLFS